MECSLQVLSLLYRTAAIAYVQSLVGKLHPVWGGQVRLHTYESERERERETDCALQIALRFPGHACIPGDPLGPDLLLPYASHTHTLLLFLCSSPFRHVSTVHTCFIHLRAPNWENWWHIDGTAPSSAGAVPPFISAAQACRTSTTGSKSSTTSRVCSVFSSQTCQVRFASRLALLASPCLHFVTHG